MNRPKQPSIPHRPTAKSTGPEIKWTLRFLAMILVVHLAGLTDPTFGFFVGLGVIVIYFALFVQNPKTAFFVLFGSKLTFDTLWYIPPAFGPLRLTEIVIFLFVIGTLSVFRKKLPIMGTIVLSLLFASWIVLAQLFNGDLRFDLLIRLSGSVIGFLCGLGMFESRRDINLIFKLLLLSTIIPICGSVIQLFAAQFGYSWLFFTLDSVRGVRYSGMYYDAATTGMVMLVSILASIYLVYPKTVHGLFQFCVYGIAGTAYFLALVGATRSVVAVATLAIVAFLIVRFSNAIKFTPFIVFAIILGQPYVEKLQQRTLAEIDRSKMSFNKIEFDKLLVDESYGGLLTGRMMLWQESMMVYNQGSALQQLFGSGIALRSHSTYFFLLLYGGILGLLIYVVFNIALLRLVSRPTPDKGIRNVAWIALAAFMLMGLSTTTVSYSSFQWIVYLIVGASIRMSHAPTPSPGQVRHSG